MHSVGVRYVFPPQVLLCCSNLPSEYVYTGKMLMENATLQLLLETVEVSNYWHILGLLDDLQHEIIRRRFITPSTLDLSE